MSERKVLTKYYPPDFDPSKIVRSKGSSKKEPGQAAKLATVRLMAPFSMKCLVCGEFIYKGRKFNARKETTSETYLHIPIFRFYIRCTRCSAEITFKTDPKRMDYTAEKGAKRNFEMWRQSDDADGEGGGNGADGLETEEEMLDRLEAEAAAAQGAAGAMAELEAKVHDARTEMAVADALDEIRMRNARISRAEGKEGDGTGRAVEAAELKRKEMEEEKRRIEREDEETARRAFAGARMAREGGLLDIEIGMDDGDEDGAGILTTRTVHHAAQDSKVNDDNDDEAASAAEGILGPSLQPPKPAQTKATVPSSSTTTSMPPPTFKKQVKKKKDFSAVLGIAKKKQPSLV